MVVLDLDRRVVLEALEVDVAGLVADEGEGPVGPVSRGGRRGRRGDGEPNGGRAGAGRSDALRRDLATQPRCAVPGGGAADRAGEPQRDRSRGGATGRV